MHHDIQLFAEYAVTPFVGVWIETYRSFASLAPSDLSHPSWVYGLKPEERTKDVRDKLSHPSWVYGLKHINLNMRERVIRHTLRGCVD